MDFGGESGCKKGGISSLFACCAGVAGVFSHSIDSNFPSPATLFRRVHHLKLQAVQVVSSRAGIMVKN